MKVTRTMNNNDNSKSGNDKRFNNDHNDTNIVSLFLVNVFFTSA